jgi:hypothetical protein
VVNRGGRPPPPTPGTVYFFFVAFFLGAAFFFVAIERLTSFLVWGPATTGLQIAVYFFFLAGFFAIAFFLAAMNAHLLSVPPPREGVGSLPFPDGSLAGPAREGSRRQTR